ncbi:MAG: glutamate formimidoyltransferase [Armatimonadota bacterium]|nr:glutamate formimidoyltransferase [Armatimonadota bacterium]MDR7486918.1 glutamate formimidoyltransferase [Armatimonadota bacterium]MDR7534536.1 glutamate formimidoyltransferase [Armatimonadota bacterium]MDR7537629.1 glutamate formimidoyltransferase [Armatimonadota bacterium]
MDPVPARLVECVPNVSEGRRQEVVDAIVQAVRAVDGVRVLHVHSDPSHNRSVITFAGAADAVGRAALALARAAVERIDLRTHRGEHPRIGAVDVIPFVPVGETSMEECVALARQVGQEIWGTLRVPVYFYAQAATAPHRIRLPEIRKGEFEGLGEKMAQADWAPDVGDPRPHPSAGAVAVGARRPLVAYNINLHTADVGVARAVARAVRESGGGLVNVQAMGVMAASGQAQVSINVLDPMQTPLHRVFDLVRLEADRHGVAVAESEIVGLVPLDALVDVARAYLRLWRFERSQVLEVQLME